MMVTTAKVKDASPNTGGGGNDLLTQIDTADFDPVTNETNISIGTGTKWLEAIPRNSASMVLYGARREFLRKGALFGGLIMVLLVASQL